ncbi:MAG: iron-sulfur cluster assembly protein [Candidatus Freyrarchaeum guaymaensis]|nr:iron-sulfur cluster assembly protein [Candidatus Sigynarchaeota archaeon]
MVDDISEEEAVKVVSQVIHLAIDCTLVDLGIVKKIKVENNKVFVTLAFPFPNIPIKEYLINSVKEPLEKLGAEVEIKTRVMTPEELEAFLEMEQKHWKGV